MTCTTLQVQYLEPRLHLSATLLKDLNPLSTFDPSREIIQVGGTTFLVAYNHLHGEELWKLTDDGRPKLVADISPGPDSSQLHDLVALDDLLLFDARHPDLGDVVMRSDGTARGTTVLHDASPRTDGSSSIRLARAPVAGRLFFSVSNDSEWTTYKLFVTDGTPAGTRRVKAGAAEGRDWLLHRGLVVGDKFYVPASHGDTAELWVIDAATATARHINLPPIGDDLPQLQRVGDVLYFTTTRPGGGSPRIWKLAPAADAPVPVAHFGPRRTLHNLTPLGDDLLFTVARGESNAELWKLDPATTSPRGAVKVSDTSPVPADFYQHSAVWDGHLYFAPEKGGLWRSDGTPQGTRLAPDLPDPTEWIFTILPRDDGIYFLASGQTNHVHLWHADGTRTRLVSDLDNNSGRTSDSISLVGDRIAYHEDPRHLWISDGTTAGTHPVPHPRDRATRGSNPRVGVVFNGAFYFAAGHDSPDGQANALWKTDGTPAGTLLVRQFDHDLIRMKVVGGRLLIWEALDYLGIPHGSHLWSTDGTAEGTLLLRDVHHSRAWPVAPGAERYIYPGSDETRDHELWATDGTAAGTFRLKDIHPGPRTSDPRHLATLGDVTLFIADDGTHGRELWTTDGTSDGTLRLTDLVPGPESIASISGVAASGRFYFIFTNSTGDLSDVWVTDGTAAGTRLHAPWSLSTTTARSVRGFVELAGAVYFFARTEDHALSLWRSGLDGGAAMRITRFPRNSNHLADPAPVVANGKIFFALTNSGAYELWASDGTEAGTRRLGKRIAGISSRSFHVLPDRVLFVAHDNHRARELWQSDGTREGTRPLTDLAEPWTAYVSHILGLFNDKLLISATDGPHGLEPWVVRLE